MASLDDIAAVRSNTDEPNEDDFSDEALGLLIDAAGVNGASATVWERKAAKYAKLVNTSEAGASRSLSDLHKNAKTLADMFNAKVMGAMTTTGHVRTRKIVRPV